jgi:catechol 2,3-dioxygenase-like lactoylglutathione lyase family enzyme
LSVAITALHPILYVTDAQAERAFFEQFGFRTTFEGEEFPGFLAVEAGTARFGISSNRGPLQSPAHEGVRWQLLVDDVEAVVAVCTAQGWAFEEDVEVGGSTHRARIVKVLSPNGVTVWFEGPNEATADG